MNIKKTFFIQKNTSYPKIPMSRTSMEKGLKDKTPG